MSRQWQNRIWIYFHKIFALKKKSIKITFNQTNNKICYEDKRKCFVVLQFFYLNHPFPKHVPPKLVPNGHFQPCPHFPSSGILANFFPRRSVAFFSLIKSDLWQGVGVINFVRRFDTNSTADVHPKWGWGKMFYQSSRWTIEKTFELESLSEGVSTKFCFFFYLFQHQLNILAEMVKILWSLIFVTFLLIRSTLFFAWPWRHVPLSNVTGRRWRYCHCWDLLVEHLTMFLFPLLLLICRWDVFRGRGTSNQLLDRNYPYKMSKN